MAAPAATSLASTQPDTSRFNGLQTTGREYRNLSTGDHVMMRDIDQRVPVRDGGFLFADVYRPSAQGTFPVLIAASPYPRQIQDLREVDPTESRAGAPILPCRNPQAVPIGEPVEYRIPLIPNPRRFRVGHRIQLMVTSDDQPKDIPALLDYRHPPVGTTTRNTIHSSSSLLLPVLRTGDQ